ncbi:STY4851/ECs_5259 family protein [Labrys neptuniae]|uniref:STY4851/ECs_5259 family protein n=1 Tax=Labrys neptuniae TaxID=376174 RepID=A0ABV3PXR9_9HYPH
MSRSELINGFSDLLAARGLDTPDRRPLYAYRFTKDEYNHTAALLRRHGLNALSDRTGAALIVAYISEWFRRERGGGHWDWIRPLRSIGLDYGQGRRVQYSDVEDLVQRGLLIWRRPLPNSGERLLAIVRESGFPVAAVREDPRISAWLKHAVLSAERGFQVDQAVGVEAWRVSDRLAQALVEPAIELCRAIVALRATIPTEARNGDPVAFLDGCTPSWRDALPFDVDQDDIRTLVERMVRLREGGTSALDVERTVVNTDKNEWTAHASLVLTGTLDIHRVPPSITQALSEGRRLRIFPRIPHSEELTAIAAIETYKGEDDEIHELRPFVTKFDVELALEREVRLFAQAGHTAIGEFVPSGGQALDSPVIALDVIELDEAQYPRVLRAIGCSSCQTSKPMLALAVQPNILPLIVFSNAPQDIGICRTSGRRIVLFEGTATLEGDGARWRWRTKAERNLQAQPILVGDLVANIRETVYRGMPRLWIEQDGYTIAPRQDSLAWRPRRRGPWRSLRNAAPIGAIEIAVIEEGEIRYAIPADVVPASMEIAFDRTQRELRISGLQTTMVAATGAGQLKVRHAHGLNVIDLGPPTGTPVITIRVRWETEISLTLSDPRYELRLVDEHDRLINTRAGFALDGLGGIRILATCEVALCMELRAQDVSRLAISRPITGNVPLSALRDTIRQLLGRSTTLDASVVLSAVGASEHLAEVRWYVEDVDPFAVPRSSAFAALASINALNLRAVSLIDASAGVRSVVAPASQSAMRAELEVELPNGPWLVFGNRKTGEIVRPRIVPAGKAPPKGATPLVRAVSNDAIPARSRAFADLYANPAKMPREDVRALIELLVLARRENLPLSSIDGLRTLDGAPATAVHLFAACDSLEERASLLNLQRDLPFLWCATTIEAWLVSFETRLETIRGRLGAAGIELDVANRLIMTALSETANLRPELAGHVRAVVLSMVASGLAMSGITPTFPLPAYRIDARTEIGRMITRHADRDHPPSSTLSDETLTAQRTQWEAFDPRFAGVIAAPFAVADHAAGIRSLSRIELMRCRDAALYDPEYFEVIVPMRINQKLHKITRTKGTAA